MDDQEPTLDVDASIGDSLVLLDSLLPEHVSEDAPLEELATRLDILKRIEGQARYLRSAIEEMLCDSMPDSQMNLGPLRVTQQNTKRTKWREGGAATFNVELASAIASDIVKPDPETGEVKRGYVELARQGAAAALGAIYQPKDIKKAARERYGVEMRDYQEIEWRNTITVQPLGEQP